MNVINMRLSKYLLCILLALIFASELSASRVSRFFQVKNWNGKGKNLKTIMKKTIRQVPVRTGLPLSTCSNKNPFLKHLYQRGVDLFTQPQMQANGCPGEWSLHGTCCNKTQLQDYAKKDKQDIIAASKLLIEQTLLFVNGAKSLYSIISDLTKDDSDSRRSNRFVLKLMHGFDQTNLRYFASLMDQMNSPQEIKNFTAETKQCWATVSDLRNRALCETCSGRSQVFFEDDLAKISQATCSKLMQACMDSFSFTIRFLKVLGILSENIKGSKLVSERCWRIKSRLKRLGTISHEIAAGHLTSRISRFRPMKSIAFHPTQIQISKDQEQKAKKDIELEYLTEASNLCNKFLRLSKEPFILEIADYFDIDMEIFEKASKAIRDIPRPVIISKAKPTRASTRHATRSRPVRSTNWSLQQRFLKLECSTKSTSTTSNQLFTGDTTTCQTNCLSMDLSQYP